MEGFNGYFGGFNGNLVYSMFRSISISFNIVGVILII